MKEQDTVDYSAAESDAAAEALPLTPIVIPASGLYSTAGIIPGLVDDAGEASALDAGPIAPVPITPGPIFPIAGEELRLDVDGRYPQMTASGTIPISPLQRLHWIAALANTGVNQYAGGIWFKDPAATPFAYTKVEIKVTKSLIVANRKVTATFTGAGLPARTRVYGFRSPYFHKVEFEYDREQNINPVLQFATGSHPNRPATLPVETLSLGKVFQRAGFDVSINPNTNPIPAPAGTTWSDMEMHDSMVAHWSRFANKPQWSMWVLFARQHEMGSSLGGIMFDDIGPNHRQGTAVFYDSFISTIPAGDPAPAAYQNRMRFWTVVHEMGHAFNLAHSWQKALGTPWIPLPNEPTARSFMNYPHAPAVGGPAAFFTSFEYRFSNPEMLFMRHAPGRFVRMGDAAWFDHHGFEEATRSPEPRFSLEVRVNRARPVFEFMEPVVAELKLKNISGEPLIVDENMLKTLDGITIALKRQGAPARQYGSFAKYCMKASPKVLQPNQAIYESVFLTSGLNGVDVATPGRYIIQAALHQPDGDIVSAPLELRISRPRNFEEESLAQDFFDTDVQRVLAFDGSRVLNDANGVLHEVANRLSGQRVALHSRVPLGLAVAKTSHLVAPATTTGAGRAAASIDTMEARPEEARDQLAAALLTASDVAAESLGHIDYKVYVDKLTDIFEALGQRSEAAKAQSTLHQILAARKVLPSVLEEIDARRNALQGAAPGPEPGRAKTAR